MTTADILLALLIVGFVAWIAWEIHRAPVEDYDTDLSDDAIAALDARAEEIIGASRPAELRPHIKAGTAWGEPL